MYCMSCGQFDSIWTSVKLGIGNIWPTSSIDLAHGGSSTFNIKSGPCALAKCTERWMTVSRWAGFSHTLIVDGDWLSCTCWRWLAPLHLTCLVTSPVPLPGHFLVKFGKIAIKLKIGGVDFKTILNNAKSLRVLPVFSQIWHLCLCWYGPFRKLFSVKNCYLFNFYVKITSLACSKFIRGSCSPQPQQVFRPL